MMSWQAWSPPEGWPLGAPSVRWQHLAPGLGHEARLWLFHLDAPDADTPMLTACLSEAEQARAQRFRQALHRQRHRVTWAMVRHLLAHLSQRPACELTWHTGTHGKPALLDARAKAGQTSSLRFNLSHSGGWALLATSQTLELGVDLEEHTSRSHLAEMAERILSKEEPTHLNTDSSADEHTRALLQAWTRKEACQKALSTGLNREMDTLTLHATQARTADEHMAALGPLPALGWADIALPADCAAWAAWAWRVAEPPPLTSARP